MCLGYSASLSAFALTPADKAINMRQLRWLHGPAPGISTLRPFADRAFEGFTQLSYGRKRIVALNTLFL